MTSRIISYWAGSLLTLSSLCGFGQTTESAKTVAQSFDTYRRQTIQEKLFVHTDQSAYMVGETIWFKVYYVDATLHQPLDISKVAYVEVLDKEQRSVLQAKVELTANGGSGAFFLPSSLNSGTYRLRAYTNWMKNFSADFFFEKNLTIVNSFKPLGLPFAKQNSDYDIQFFPEGGHLVQGIASNVAFKIADESGKGVAVRGGIINAQNDTLVRFQSQKFGIGRFSFAPSEVATYRAVVFDEKGRPFTRSLPAVKAQGYVMRLEESGPDQLKITVNTNLSNVGSISLFAHTRQEIKVAETKFMQQEATFQVDKKVLGDGVSHLTIFDAAQKPVCERLYFKRPMQELRIQLKSDHPQYASRTKVTLDASAQASAGKINRPSMSVAVYRVDSLADGASDNILNYLWMTSDLAGRIESPDYYLQPTNADVALATDNLMLTHGWRRFRWDDLLQKNPVTRPYIAEPNGLVIQGSVTNPETGKPVPNIVTYLSTLGKPTRLYVFRSDAEGRVRYEMQDFYGPKNIFAQTNPEDSLNKLTIDNPFSTSISAYRLPELAINESHATQLLNRSVAMQVQSTYWGDDIIRYRYPDVDSSAFYGKPSETYLLDAYTRFPRMEEVLREYVTGVLPRKRDGHFRLMVPNLPYRSLFEEPSMVLMDGVPIFNMDRVIEFNPLKVKQIDVVTNRYLMGMTAFSGIINFMTYKNDLSGFLLDNRLVKLDYDGLQLQREFYIPRYETPKQQTSRLPDGRTLLYWNPNLLVNAEGKSQVDFYTSDQTGTYLVEINGLAPDGRAGYQRTLFDVKNTPK
ncbi:Plug domain-containing protein [Spirosoma daeguense]